MKFKNKLKKATCMFVVALTVGNISYSEALESIVLENDELIIKEESLEKEKEIINEENLLDFKITGDSSPDHVTKPPVTSFELFPEVALPWDNNLPSDFSSFETVDNSFFFEEEKKPEKEKKPGDSFIQTERTIHYLSSQEGDYLRYRDTGIRIENEIIKEEDLTSIVLIASRDNALRIREEEGFFLLNVGKTTVELPKKDLKISEFNEILKPLDFQLEEKASRVSNKFSLADSLEITNTLNIEVNGELLEVDTPYKIRDSRTLLPIRHIAEAMGADVNWNSRNNEVTIRKDGKTIKINPESEYITVNGKRHLVTAKSYLNLDTGRTLTPVTLIVRELGGEVFYRTSDKTVVIKH